MPPTPPTDKTLKKYGLTRQDFDELLRSQAGVCAVCQLAPNGRWNIDHDHVRGWARMPDGLRKKFVRGVLCWRCNKYFAGPGISVKRAEALVIYLRRYEERKPWDLRKI